MKGNILITGGLGFIGSHIVEALARTRELTIVAYDVQAKDNCVGNVVTLRGDVFNFDRLVKVMRDREISKVIHMVGLVSIPQCRRTPDVSFRLNVLSVHSVLEAMRLSGAEHLVFPSTAVVYGAVNGPKVSEEVKPKPTTVYGCHKLAAESLIRGYTEDYGFKTTILRVFNVYGDLKKEHGVVSIFINRALAGKRIVINGGEQLRDFVHLNDVIKAFTKSLDNAAACQKIINVGSGSNLSIKEVAGIVKQSFPEVEIECKPLCKGDYSYYADVSRMRSLLAFDPLDARKGIPMFIEECTPERVN